MSNNNGVHYLALNNAKQRLTVKTKEMDAARVQLDEALKMGDLRENSEYDAARTSVNKLLVELDQLNRVSTMQAVRSADGVDIIQEGSVIDLVIYSLTSTPLVTDSEEFEELKKKTPEFHGVLGFGATLEFHELLTDKLLSVDTPIGKFLKDKQSGDYSVSVPAGFVNLTVTKLDTSSIKQEDLYCKLGAECG